MGAVAADVMLVFGDVGEMREIAVGANDRERLIGAKAVERRLELTPGGDLIVAMEPDRGPADLLDQLEDLFAFLLAHRVAEDSAEQADVVAERHILIRLFRRLVGHAVDRGVEGHRGMSVGEGVGRMLHCGSLRCKREKTAGASPLYGRGASASSATNRAPSAALSLSSHS